MKLSRWSGPLSNPTGIKQNKIMPNQFSRLPTHELPYTTILYQD